MSIPRSIPLTVLVVVALAQPAFATLPITSEPTIQLDRTIRTTPFVNSSVSMRDGEGNAYVPGDDSLWLVEDHDNSAFEVDPTTGELKRVITSAAFQDAPRFGGGTVAGPNRTEDFEAVAYDAFSDVLYVFSGPCCDSSVLPTAFRLTRQSGTFQVESYQPLPAGSDFTAAAWNPSDGTLYVGHGAALRTYDYESNTPGPTFSVANLSGITGLVFSQADDEDLFVATNAERIRRVDWATKTLVPGWTFDLTPFGVKDSRAVELIRDQFYVLDGYDSRPAGDPLRFAVFVFDVLGPGPAPPNASFTATPTSGPPPLDVSFTDTSTGAEGWLWDFGDGSPTSTEQHPTHTFSSEGTFTVTLTASNTVGTDTATRTITVSEQPPPSGNLVGNPGFEGDLTGWSTTGSGAEVTMDLDPGSHSGSWSAKLVNGASVSRKCVLNDSPDWVTSTPAPSYTASAWVRAGSAGKRISILVRELSSGGAVVGSRVRRFALSTSWQEITVSWTPGSPTSSLDLQIFLPRAQAPPGTCFFADDISIIGS